MVINHNISALNTFNKLKANTTSAQNSLEKLSSGLRINRAADDAAGLSISEKMKAQVSGLDTASDNAQKGISLVQTAEGALNETHSILQRMRELTVQAANGTNENTDTDAIKAELDQLSDEINVIGTDTQFNGKKLLDGALGGSSASGFGADIGAAAGIDSITANGAAAGTYTLEYDGTDTLSLSDGTNTESFTISSAPTAGTTQDIKFANLGVSVKINSGFDTGTAIADTAGSASFTVATSNTLRLMIGSNQGQDMDLSVSDMRASALGVQTSNLKVDTNANSEATTALIDTAITSVSTQRSQLGAYQNRLSHTINNLSVESENLTSAQSQITDVDMAKEMSSYSRNNILIQSATAMLAHANQLPQGILSLLQG